jgi:hypothetical protein
MRTQDVIRTYIWFPVRDTSSLSNTGVSDITLALLAWLWPCTPLLPHPSVMWVTVPCMLFIRANGWSCWDSTWRIVSLHYHVVMHPHIRHQDHSGRKVPYHWHEPIHHAMCAPVCIHDQFNLCHSGAVETGPWSHMESVVSCLHQCTRFNLMEHRSKQKNHEYKDHCTVMMAFYPQLKTQLLSRSSDGKVQFQSSVRTQTGPNWMLIWGSGLGVDLNWTNGPIWGLANPWTLLNTFRTSLNLNW